MTAPPHPAALRTPSADGVVTVADALRAALARGQTRSARTIALSVLGSGVGLEDFYENLIRPLLDELGARWQAGSVSIGEEHIYTATLRTLIARLGDLPDPPPTRGRVVLLHPSCEQHLLGLMMLRHVLRHHGWRVSAPDPLPLTALVDLVRRLGDVVVVGVTLHECPDPHPLREWIIRYRQALPSLPVILGGLALRKDPDLWRRVGASGAATDLPGALALIDGLTNPLTDREREILAMVSNGATTEEMAQALAIKPSTVKTHLERIYAKLGARDRASSVALALRRRWID